MTSVTSDPNRGLCWLRKVMYGGRGSTRLIHMSFSPLRGLGTRAEIFSLCFANISAMISNLTLGLQSLSYVHYRLLWLAPVFLAISTLQLGKWRCWMIKIQISEIQKMNSLWLDEHALRDVNWGWFSWIRHHYAGFLIMYHLHRAFTDEQKQSCCEEF